MVLCREHVSLSQYRKIFFDSFLLFLSHQLKTINYYLSSVTRFEAFTYYLFSRYLLPTCHVTKYWSISHSFYLICQSPMSSSIFIFLWHATTWSCVQYVEKENMLYFSPWWHSHGKNKMKKSLVITQECCAKFKKYIICYIEMCVAFEEVKLFWNYWGRPIFMPLSIQFRAQINALKLSDSLKGF